jgi:hypothetical protein
MDVEPAAARCNGGLAAANQPQRSLQLCHWRGKNMSGRPRQQIPRNQLPAMQGASSDCARLASWRFDAPRFAPYIAAHGHVIGPRDFFDPPPP